MDSSSENKKDKLHDYFVSDHSINFNTIEWKKITRFSKDRTLSELMSDITEQFSLIRCSLFTHHGKIIGHSKKPFSWPKLESHVLNYQKIVIQDHFEDHLLVLAPIKSREFHLQFIFEQKKDDFDYSKLKTLLSVVEIILLEKVSTWDTRFKQEQVSFSSHTIKSTPFPYIVKKSVNTIFAPKVASAKEIILNNLKHLEFNPIHHSKKENIIDFKLCDILIFENIHQDLDAQEYFLALRKQGIVSTILLLFSEDPFYLYSKGHLPEAIYRIIETSEYSEYATSPIIESSLEEHDILDAFNTVWVKKEKEAA